MSIFILRSIPYRYCQLPYVILSQFVFHIDSVIFHIATVIFHIDTVIFLIDTVIVHVDTVNFHIHDVIFHVDTVTSHIDTVILRSSSITILSSFSDPVLTSVRPSFGALALTPYEEGVKAFCVSPGFKGMKCDWATEQVGWRCRLNQ